ncbi:MAG: hypothetical protein Q8J78_15695, partial [Moraxellaceae bacterium]|nr:hypothetical protein [Moraxellaceae bacterium]
MNTSNVQESMVCGGWRWVLPCLVALLGVLLAPAVVEAATKERIRFHVQDHAGSTMRVLTPEGFVVAKYRYSPFGEQLADKVATADRVRSAYVSGIQERNDLLYLKHRYYNPVIGRFYQPD